MPATTITRSARYTSPGHTQIVWIPTIADSGHEPTRLEINAGTAINCEVAAITGFTKTAQFIETPDLCSDSVPKIFSKYQMEDSSIDFYADLDGEDVREILTAGLVGFVAIMLGGDVEDRLMDVWPVTVGGIAKPIDVAGQNAQILRVSFSITSAPAEDVAIPAAA